MIAALLSMSLLIMGCGALGDGDRVVYRIILPADYIGWVRFDFGVAGAKELRWKTSEAGQMATFVVPESGFVQTSSIFAAGLEYELFYDEGGRLVPVPKDFYSSSDIDLGGFTMEQRDAQGNSTALSLYFLVGPKWLKAKYPESDYTWWNSKGQSYLRTDKDAKLPQPGRIHLEQKP